MSASGGPMSATGVPAGIQHTAGDSGGSSPQAGTSAGGSGGSSPRASTVPRPMRADAQRNYQRLLDAAVAVFAERGADDVSLEEIARRAGVGIGTLYRHFPTRQALLEAVYRDQVETLAARSTALLGSADPVAALEEWLGALTVFGVAKRSMNKTLLETLGKNSELFSSCGTMLRQATTQLVEQAQSAGVVRTDVNGTDVLRLVHGMMLACDLAPGDE